MYRVLLILPLVNLALAGKYDCADYYWRDYFGTIPSDAYSAGFDQHGDPVYIGIVYIRGHEYLTAMILPKQKIAVTCAYDQVLSSSENIKILCSPNQEAFQWTSIEGSKLPDYLSKNLVPGGSEIGHQLYVGRIFRDNSVYVGKYFGNHKDIKQFAYPYGNTPASTLNYQILYYDCARVCDCKVPKCGSSFS